MDNAIYILSAGLEFFFALISVILLAGCLFDHERARKSNRIMTVILAVNAVMNAVDACVWLWCDYPELLTLMQTLSFISYLFGSIITALFSYLLVTYIREYTQIGKWIDRTIFGVSVFMSALWVVSIFNGMYYYWDENGVCHVGELFWLSQSFGIMFFLFDIVLVVFYRRVLGRKDTAILVLYSVIPLASFFLVAYWDVTPLYMATTIVLLLYYIIIHVEHGQRIAEQETKLVKQELELTNSRTAIILTQIRPHFLYNSLTAIAQLCEKDPKKAKETTLNFSEYLRRNMDSLEQNKPIPFARELEHVKNYLAIERVRFGDELRVVYNIKAADFLLPPLSMQTIVENAVKHGVGMKEDGGTVTISSDETPDSYEIIVSDDGVGFDVGTISPDDKKHLGIRLVKVRLGELVGGTLHVVSRPGIGTDVMIRIPKTKE